MMANVEKPKRIIDRERQWRKVDTSHYRSPKGRFEAAREADTGWVLVDVDGELPTAFFETWKEARAYVEAIEFAAPAPAPIVFETDEIRDEFHDVYRIKATRGGVDVFEVIARNGRIVLPQLDDVPVDVAEALATALMVATHNSTSEGR